MVKLDFNFSPNLICKIILLVLSAVTTVKGQTSYIAFDSTISAGVEILDNTKRTKFLYVIIRKGGKTIKYTPNDIKGYGLKNGDVFVTKKMLINGKSQRLFLKQIESGKITLYHFISRGSNKFYLEVEDSALIELSKKNYRDRIKKLMSESDWLISEIEKVNYSRRSLANLVNIYNHQSEPSELLRTNYVLHAGYNFSVMTVPSELLEGNFQNMDFYPNSSLQLGFKISIPIKYNKPKLLITSGINYKKFGFTGTATTDFGYIDAVANLSALEIPLLIQHPIEISKWSPYINMGGTLLFNFKNSSELFSTNINQNIVQIDNLYTKPFVSQFIPGISISAGSNWKVIGQTIMFEIRYTHYLRESTTFSIDQMTVTIGYNF